MEFLVNFINSDFGFSIIKYFPNISITVFYVLFFNITFYNPQNSRFKAASISFAILSIGIALLLQLSFLSFYLENDPFIKAFITSSFFEEFAKFICIYFFFKTVSNYPLTDGIYFGILFGIVFGFIENIIYSFNISFWPLTLRAITSLPLHLLTSAIHGYYVLLFFYNRLNVFSTLLVIKSLFITTIFHGFYNYVIFERDQLILFAPLVLVGLFLILQIQIEKAKNKLPKFILETLNLYLNEYELIQKFIRSRAWIHNIQNEKIETKISLFQKLDFKYILFILFFSLYALTFTFILLLNDKHLPILFTGINTKEYLSIFIFYPLYISLNFLLSGIFNPMYFRDRVIKVPLSAVVMILHKGKEENSLIYNIETSGFYCPLKKPEIYTEECTFEFWFLNKSFSNIKGKAVWSNSDEEKLDERGALFQFTKFPIKLLIYWKIAKFKQTIKNFIRFL